MSISGLKILVLLFVFSGTTSIAQSFGWGYRAGGSSWDDVLSMHLGVDNNLLVTGMFQNTADFGAVSITSSWFQDGFVAKYDELGNVQWANAINGDGGQVWGTDVTSDANNNVYVTGYFQGPAIYFTENDSIEINSGSTSDVFLAKYNSTGVFQWARSGEGIYSLGKSITCDNQNNVIISGSYNGTVAFSGTSTPSSPTGVYLVKYDADGNLLWVKSGTSNSQCWFNDLDIDGSDNIYATGKISSNITFGGQTVTNHGGDDMAIAKFNSSGNLQWMEVVGTNIMVSTTSNNFDCGRGIVLDQSGNIFVGGSLIDTAYWGPGGNATFQFATVMKYNNNGTQQWIKKYGNHELDAINDIALDNNGDPYVIGNYFDMFSIGSFQLPNQFIDLRAFMAKFNASNGDPIWAVDHGTSSAGENTGVGIQINPITNDLYSTGVFENIFVFGSNSLQSVGSWDIYLVLNNNILGIENLTNSDNMFIYPNPVNTTLTLSHPTNDLSGAQVFIYNLSGQIVLQQQLISQQNVIVVDALEPGNYLVKIQSQEGEYHKKIVKL